jgi:hypothetical protein
VKPSTRAAVYSIYSVHLVSYRESRI